MKAFFVTGTDTGVGKTTVACALLAAARARGLRALGMKPIETGCVAGPDGIPLALDAIALESATRERPAGTRYDLDAIALASATRERPAAARYNIYRFAAPLAPSVAAELEGAAVALAPILRGVDRLRSLAPDLLLVEGAGGLLVPLTASTDMADLAVALALPLIVVARDGLGTINHTLLTLEAAAARGLQVAAVILSGATPGTSDRDAARNVEEIARRGRVPVVGRLPHLAALPAYPPPEIPTPPDAPRANTRRASDARTESTRADSARPSDARTESSSADPPPPGNARADSTRADSTRADSARTDAARADTARARDTRTDATHAEAARAHSTHAHSTHAHSTPSHSTPSHSTHAGPLSGRAEPSRAASSVEELGPSLAQLAAAAEAHLDLAILLPDDVA